MKHIKFMYIALVVASAVMASGLYLKQYMDKENLKEIINKTSYCSQDAGYDAIYNLSNKSSNFVNKSSLKKITALIDIAKSCSIKTTDRNAMLDIFGSAFSELTWDQQIDIFKQTPGMQSEFVGAILKSKYNKISDSNLPDFFGGITSSVKYKDAIVSVYASKLSSINKSYIENIKNNLNQIKAIDDDIKKNIQSIKDNFSNYITVNNFLDRNYKINYGSVSDVTLKNISKLENIYDSIGNSDLREYIVTTTFEFPSHDGGYDYNAILNGSMRVIVHASENNKLSIRSTMRLMLKYIGAEEVSTINGDSKQIWDKYEVIPYSMVREYTTTASNVIDGINQVIARQGLSSQLQVPSSTDSPNLPVGANETDQYKGYVDDPSKPLEKRYNLAIDAIFSHNMNGGRYINSPQDFIIKILTDPKSTADMKFINKLEQDIKNDPCSTGSACARETEIEKAKEIRGKIRVPQHK